MKHGQLNLKFEKSDGATCSDTDCTDALAEVWSECELSPSFPTLLTLSNPHLAPEADHSRIPGAEYASRPDGDDSDLQDKNGPLFDEGTIDSECGTYTYSLSNPASTTTSAAPTITTGFSPPILAYPTKGPIQCAEYLYSYDKCTNGNDFMRDYVEKTADAFWGDMGTEPLSADTRNRTQRLRKGGEGGSGVNYCTLSSLKPSRGFFFGRWPTDCLFPLSDERRLDPRLR